MGLLVSSAFKEKCLKDKIKNNSYKDSTVWAELQDKKSKERWEEKQTLDQMWEKEHFLCRSFSPWQFNLTNMCVWHMRGRRQRRGEGERERERGFAFFSIDVSVLQSLWPLPPSTFQPSPPSVFSLLLKCPTLFRASFFSLYFYGTCISTYSSSTLNPHITLSVCLSLAFPNFFPLFLPSLSAISAFFPLCQRHRFLCFLSLPFLPSLTIRF